MPVMVVLIMPSMKKPRKVSHTTLPRHGACAVLRQDAACVLARRAKKVAHLAAVLKSVAPKEAVLMVAAARVARLDVAPMVAASMVAVQVDAAQADAAPLVVVP